MLLRKGKSISIVHDFEFRKLLNSGRPARVTDQVVGEPVQWLNAPSEAQFRSIAKLTGPVDREHTAHGRVEQGYLRQSYSAERTGLRIRCAGEAFQLPFLWLLI